MNYYSQFSQDKIVDIVLNRKTKGVFIDIGAHDGISGSNSYFFEKERQWTGIGIEPNPDVYKKLITTRKCKAINAGIADTSGELEFMQCEGYTEMLSGLVSSYDENHLKRIEEEIKQHGGTYHIIKVPCLTLNDLLDKENIKQVDYCSIDTEGSEFSILKSIDFARFNFTVFSIEWNYGSQQEIVSFFKQKNFIKLCSTGCDIIFVNKSNYWPLKFYTNSFILKVTLAGELARLRKWARKILLGKS